jgi:phosphate transport system protein
MARESFAAHIKKLETELIAMGEMTAAAVSGSMEALKNGNCEAAQQIIKGDEAINKKRLEIEEKAIYLIALQQPVASDLREIIAILYIITDLERIGDYAEGIGKIVLMLKDKPLVKPLEDIPSMAEKAVSMLKDSIKAFIKRDAKAAEAICKKDDQVDELYDKVQDKLLKCMINDPTTVSRATPLIWASHNIERVADRVTNICERTIFLATGSMPEIEVSKY